MELIPGFSPLLVSQQFSEGERYERWFKSNPLSCMSELGFKLVREGGSAKLWELHSDAPPPPSLGGPTATYGSQGSM